MHHRIYEDAENNIVQEFDDEAIDWFIQGLEQLRHCSYDEAMTTPSILYDENDTPESIGEFILVRVKSND